MGRIYLEGITVNELTDIVQKAINVELDKRLPKKSPDDLMSYADIMKEYRIKTRETVSRKIGLACITPHKEGRQAYITRAEAEEIFK